MMTIYIILGKRLLCKSTHGLFEGGLDLQIDLLAIQQMSLDRALFLYIFIRKVRLNGVRTSITIVDFRKFYKM